MKVKQFHHANQFVITDGSLETFQSYNSIICIINHADNTITVDPNYCFYSNTTSRHFKLFLNENLFDEIKKITKSKDFDMNKQYPIGYTTILFKHLNE